MVAGSAGAAAWPGSSTGTTLSSTISEPSGIVWDPVSGKLYVASDSGTITRMATDGSNPTKWTPAFSGKPDYEGVAVTGSSSLVYVAVETPPAIYEFNPSTGEFTKDKSWSLSDLPSDSDNGMEGLTFVPNGYSPYPAGGSGGLFYASSQIDGTIYVYDVPLSGSGQQTLTALDHFKPDSANNDIADLYFSTATRILYVLYGNARKIIQVAGDTSLNGTTYSTPGTSTGFEGITLINTCPNNGTTTIDLADDHGPVAYYTGYPQPCASRLTDSGDATVSEQNPTQNFGSATTLTTDNSPKSETLIQFTGLSGPTVKSAKLQLFVTDGTDKSPSYCYLTTAWNEATVNWNNRPQCATANTGGGVNVPDGSWVTYDVTSLVKAGHLSFKLYPSSANDMVANSKEVGDRTPVLVVTTQP
jgi:hypothetical protein